MRLALLTLAFVALAAQAQRPQLSDVQAAQYRMQDYLGDWHPQPLKPQEWTKPDFVVAADGSGTHRTLQAALDAVPTQGRRVYIEMRPGTYREQVCVKGRAPVTLYGAGDPSAVVIVAGHYNAEGPQGINRCLPDPKATTTGTLGSASVALFSDDMQVARLTIANDAMDQVRDGIGYPADVSESGGAQAVALMTGGDRIQLQDVRLVGHQDTFYARPGRVYVRDSFITGDVDFIFGAAALVIDHSEIRSRAGRRKPGNGGHVLAPDTAWDQRYGILVVDSRLTAEPGVAPASISLGRAWDFGVARGEWKARSSPDGQALIRDSELGAHLAGWSASTSRRPYTAEGNRFAEYGNVRDLSREVLPAKDGWAAADGGTRGGADAAPADVFTVRNREQLLAAFRAAGERPKIVRIEGLIDLTLDAQGKRLGFEDFRDPAFDFEAFLKTYDPAVWGKAPITGPLEEARARSAKRQAEQIVIRVSSNTTIVGIGRDAAITGGTLFLGKVDNIIVRNLHFSDAYDLFPAWDPKDNANGEWNSEYDTITLRGATHVWVDHCTFDDGLRPDQAERIALGRKMQHHDGLLDITQQSDLVTVSWNRFTQHDKTMLIGSSDSQKLDEGRLRVTLHHNLFEQVKERTPRVRWGQVHVYDNLFVGRSDVPYAYGYSLGVGVNSRIVSEANAFDMSADIPAGKLVHWWKGSVFSDRGSVLNGKPVDLLAELRAANPQASLSAEVGWQPQWLAEPVEPAEQAAARIREAAGAARGLRP
ncbi:pectinesterase family protein [Pelomonas sp. KK5]|uniref:pectinesterase family protein n=1 Tax=Pelomonas sp. KK5 TaxID=1855730 RepID=UPI0009F89D5A|nr:pectinesterase family protein [Pelomonas sp. KK5]